MRVSFGSFFLVLHLLLVKIVHSNLATLANCHRRHQQQQQQRKIHDEKSTLIKLKIKPTLMEL